MVRTLAIVCFGFSLLFALVGSISFFRGGGSFLFIFLFSINMLQAFQVLKQRTGLSPFACVLNAFFAILLVKNSIMGTYYPLEIAEHGILVLIIPLVYLAFNASLFPLLRYAKKLKAKSVTVVHS
jgi:hypothetical protein